MNEISEDSSKILVFYDVSHLEYQVKSTKNWQKKGKNNTKILKTNPSKKRINLLGSLDRELNRFTVFITENSCNKEEACRFLEKTKKTYRWSRKKIHLVLDMAKYNLSYTTQEKAQDLEIALEYLPKSSPNLNIIERFWKFVKKEVVNNKYYETYEQFNEAVDEFFYNLDQYKDELDSLLNLDFEIIKPI